ncbi:hypothetical protein AB1E18_016067 [Capra hircus]
MGAGRWAEGPMARREGACPGCPWRRRWESPCGQWRFRSGSGLSELLPPPPPPPGEGRPPPACAQRLTQPQSRQSANTVETPWRRVGPNSSPAASRECRAPQPGPRPGTRSSQLLADNLGGLHIQRSIKRIPHVHNMLVEALQLTPTLRVASLQ